MGWTKRCFLRQHDKGGGNQPSKGLEPFEGWVVGLTPRFLIPIKQRLLIDIAIEFVD